MVLPRFISLKSKDNNKYLRYVNEDGLTKGMLQFSSESILSPYTKFEVESAVKKNTATGGHDELVHIKCSYINKYLVRKDDTSTFIIPNSDKPEEDSSKWSCTLFEPIYDSKDDAYHFRHLEMDVPLSAWIDSPEYDNCIFTNTYHPEHNTLSIVVDLQSLFILPKHVAFKGKNGLYLKSYKKASSKYLQFAAKVNQDDDAGHEVFYENDGSIRIKSIHSDYWRRDENWIKPDGTDLSNPNGLFWPVKVSENIVALRNMGNDRYCRIITLDGKENSLNAADSRITDEAKLEVEEYIASREIYNVHYNLADSRIYGEERLTKAAQHVVNNTDEECEAAILLSYQKWKASSWGASLGMTIGVTTTLKCGIPEIIEGELETSIEMSGEYSWGEEKTDIETIQSTFTVKVPPKSARKVSVFATRGRCDIPFTYYQRDTLFNGKVVISEKIDGHYAGVNDYNFYLDSSEADMP